MRPWMGAAAIAAAMLVTPAAAFADDDAQALLKFRLDNSGQYDDFEGSGSRWTTTSTTARATT